MHAAAAARWDRARLGRDDVEQRGYVMNASRLWGRLPDEHDALFALLGDAARTAGLTVRQRGVLVAASASTLGDSSCSLAWGGKLAAAADPQVAATVRRGDDSLLDPAERALAQWAGTVVADPNGTTPEDLDALRAAGYDDTQVAAITLFVALRVAFSTVDDALGARPHRELVDGLPAVVRGAVTWGRTPPE